MESRTLAGAVQQAAGAGAAGWTAIETGPYRESRSPLHVAFIIVRAAARNILFSPYITSFIIIIIVPAPLSLSDGATVLAAARPHHHHQKRLFLLLLFVVFCLILFMISPPPIYPKSFLFFINLLDTCWLSLRARYNSPNAVCDAVNRKKKMEKKRINQRSISETVPFFSPLLSLKCVSTSRLDADRGELIRLSKRKSHLSAAAERSLVYLYKYQKSVCWLNNLWPDVKMICHHAM